MDLKELESGVDPQLHWYYQSKKVPLLRYFARLMAAQQRKLTVIDFGAGSGFFSRELLRQFPDAIEQVLLIDIGYSDDELSETASDQLRKLREIPHGVSDCVVIMMDVLEHIEDDHEVLRNVQERLGENAHYFITVPAFMSVWSNHDVFLGHYRRYTIATLQRLLRETHCETKRQYYLFGSIFSLVWLVRRVKNLAASAAPPTSSDMAPAPAPVNFLLRVWNSTEMRLSQLNRLCGLTCVAEGRLG